MALIELSPDRSAATDFPRPPAYAYRSFGLVLALILALALAGGAPVGAVRFQHAGLVALPADADVQVAGGRVFTIEVSGGRRVLSAWMTHPLRRLWRATTTAGETAGGLIQGGNSVSVAGRFVLLRAGQSTSVLDARTGAVRWTSPLPLTAVSETVAMTTEEQFKAGTEYDESSGAPGALFFSSTGQPHTEPPRRTDLVGFDLGTGRARWTVPFAGSIYPAKARGIAGAVVVVAAGELGLRAAADGSVLRSQRLPVTPGAGSAWGDVQGDLVLVRQAGLVTAYTTADLRERWQRTDPDAAGNSAVCTGLTCERDGQDLVVLDPRTGSPRWRTHGEVDLMAGAGYTIEARTGQNSPLRAVDPDSGAGRLDLRGWQSIVLAGSVVVLTRRAAGQVTEFGLLLPGRPAVRLLGSTRSQVTDCAADTRLVVCRAAAGVEVFTYAL